MIAAMNWDGNFLLWIQEHVRQDWLTPIMKFITSLGNGGCVWIAVTILLLCIKRTRKVGLMCVFALLGSVVVNNLILKNLVNRVRPYMTIDGLHLLVKKAWDPSFPSGHTGSSFAAGVVLLRNLPKKAGIPLFLLAILISLSRLYVGIHYPTDVMAGAVTGTLMALLGEWVVKKLVERAQENENHE